MHRVGIIPFDMKGDQTALLFVTSQKRGRWILPKGRRKGDETQFDACHREGLEEAGVRGRLLEDFPSTVLIGKHGKNGIQNVVVTYYPFLVETQEDDWLEKERRQRHWALLEDAPKVAYKEDYLGLIEQFRALRPWIKEAVENSKS
ncbi:MAG: NUDIX domain-containing protein [Alphaproteobacteria bacterium]|nr:NUDIX domain-containing protein [Alphaproteobacteria bacterium]